jgi:predicted dehydrogenase
LILNTYAVIGLGTVGERHIENLKRLHPNDNVIGVSASGKNLKVPPFADAILSVDELILLRPQYVVVASPAPFHILHAKLFLSEGIPVLIEKPLSNRLQNCLELQDFCIDSRSKKVAVGYCLRYLPSTVVVKKYLDNKLLGQVYNVEAHVGQYLPSWRPKMDYTNSVSAHKDLGGGALLELSHELDYLSWFFGPLKLEYSRLRKTQELGLDVEDLVDLVVISDDIHIAVHMDFIQKSSQRKCEIIGEKGRLSWNLMSNSVDFFDESGQRTVYSNDRYNKNDMYLDMLLAFEDMLEGRDTN